MHQMNPWTSGVSGTPCLIILKPLFEKLKVQPPAVQAGGKATPSLSSRLTSPPAVELKLEFSLLRSGFIRGL